MKKLVGLSNYFISAKWMRQHFSPFRASFHICNRREHCYNQLMSSAVSYGVKKQTGQSPHLNMRWLMLQKHNPENKKEKCIEFIDATNTKTCAAVKENLSETRKKIVKIKNSILDKSKIENLAKQSDLIKR